MSFIFHVYIFSLPTYILYTDLELKTYSVQTKKYKSEGIKGEKNCNYILIILKIKKKSRSVTSPDWNIVKHGMWDKVVILSNFLDNKKYPYDINHIALVDL